MKTTKMSCLVVVLLALSFVCVPVNAVAGSADDGFIYGTITTKSGNVYTGLMRWGTEEMFWDDLFHSSKDDLPYEEYAKEARKNREEDDEWWEVFGRTIRIKVGGDHVSRIFISRYGDIKSIKVVGSKDAIVTMKSGSEYEVSGYSNDVGGTIWIKDTSAGEIEVPWKKIKTIVFDNTADNVEPEAYRIYGVVVTDDGDFTGHIQWDSQEALSTDKLDGDSEDGRMSIEMGSLKSIERRSRRSALVVLDDGRELVLDGTNDVDSSIRGVLVEDDRFGRVKIPWSAFDRVDFSRVGASGPAYDDFAKTGPLRGKVISKDGTVSKGELVFDLDESETWEILNGTSFDIEYNIPFAKISSIEPKSGDSAQVTLKNGAKVRLDDSHDVSDDNDGVLVLGGGKPNHILWSGIKRIDLD